MYFTKGIHLHYILPLSDKLRGRVWVAKWHQCIPASRFVTVKLSFYPVDIKIYAMLSTDIWQGQMFYLLILVKV